MNLHQVTASLGLGEKNHPPFAASSREGGQPRVRLLESTRLAKG